MEKPIFIFQCSSVQICLKEAASGEDNADWFIQADRNVSSFCLKRVLLWEYIQVLKNLK